MPCFVLRPAWSGGALRGPAGTGGELRGDLRVLARTGGELRGADIRGWTIPYARFTVSGHAQGWRSVRPHLAALESSNRRASAWRGR